LPIENISIQNNNNFEKHYWLYEGDEHGEHDCVKTICSVYQTNICSTTMVLYIS